MSDEVQRSLGRIEGKMDRSLDWMTQHSIEDKAEFNRLSERIGRVERKTWAAGGVVSVVVAYLTTKLTGH